MYVALCVASPSRCHCLAWVSCPCWSRADEGINRGHLLHLVNPFAPRSRMSAPRCMPGTGHSPVAKGCRESGSSAPTNVTMRISPPTLATSRLHPAPPSPPSLPDDIEVYVCPPGVIHFRCSTPRPPPPPPPLTTPTAFQPFQPFPWHTVHLPVCLVRALHRLYTAFSSPQRFFFQPD